MTTIAWDGRSLAADSCGVNGGILVTSQKISNHTIGKLRVTMAFSGDLVEGLRMKDWYLEKVKAEIEGTQPSLPFPSPRVDDGECCTTLVVVNKGKCVFYTASPDYPQVVADKFFAWGSGREIALGAMAHGASAYEAVEIACDLDVYSRKPVVVFPQYERVE